MQFWMQETISFNEQPSTFFALSEEEKKHIRERETSNQLVYAILLKYFESENQFPDETIVVLPHIQGQLASQLEVSVEKFEFPKERTFRRFCASIRDFFGYVKITSSVKEELSFWLSKHVLPNAPDEDELLQATIFFCRSRRIELFAKDEMKRFFVKVSNVFEQDLLSEISESLSDKTKEILDQILKEPEESKEENSDSKNQVIPNSLEDSNKKSTTQIALEGESPKKADKNKVKKFTLVDLKKDTSHLKKESIIYEIAKYEFLKTLQLPEELFVKYPRKLLLKYTTYVQSRAPSHLRFQADSLKYGQLSIFCAIKTQQSADTLTDLLLKILHRIETKAKRYVDKYALSEIKKVKGKHDIFLTLVETLRDNPKGIIDQTIYPKVSVAELEAIAKDLLNRKWYQNHVREKSLSLYNHGYRKSLKDLLESLTFETDRKDLQDILLAIEWIKKSKSERQIKNLPYLETIRKSWGDLVQSQDKTTENSDLNAYELAVLEHFSKELRVKNIWVKQAHKYQNPANDMPPDFEEKKDFYHDWLELPKDVEAFITSLTNELEAGLLAMNETLPLNEKVKFVERKNGAIKLSPSEAQESPENLDFLHQKISELWPNVPLIDVLKEVDFRVGFTKNFPGLGVRSAISKDKVQKRLLFCLYGLGSNVGIKRLATSDTNESYSDLRYIKNRHLSSSCVRAAIQDVVNDLLKIRDPNIWGNNNVGCACDSKRFNVWVQNLLGGWHGRYRSHGVMVYTHIDEKSAPIYMQITHPGDSEVGSMLTGCLRHDTDMDMNEIYTDTHGQSSIGFAFSHLLHFDLMPRIKGINKQKLFVPSKGFKEKLPNLKLALASCYINWNKIRDNYEEVVKYTAALKTRTVDSDVLLKRVSSDNSKHPAYQALMEIGKAVRTIFLCRYLSEENLRIQINESLNVVERFNGMMGFVFHGKQGEISTNDKEDQELSVLCLHLVQLCIIYINTMMIQEILHDPSRAYQLTSSDLRALTPLIYEHINPNGIVSLDMTERLIFKINQPNNEEIND